MRVTGIVVSRQHIDGTAEWPLMTLSVGDTYIEKSMGPRTEPCRTPDSHFAEGTLGANGNVL